MFKVNKKKTLEKGVKYVQSLQQKNTVFTTFSSVSIADIEQVNVSCVKHINFKLLAKCFEWKGEAQISVIQRDKICFNYVLKMKKFPSLGGICVKLIKKWYFTYAIIQFKKPVRIFDQNSQGKMTVI